MLNFSFCNDCDLMTWDGYKNVHQVLNDLGLPAGDSFWLFDPSGGDMALFKHDIKHPGPYHDALLEKINNGDLDIMHSIGQYGARFNGGFRPSRDLVIEALDYLKKNAKVPKIWTNHGDDQNIQSIGGSQPAPHHKGDQPGSDCYIIDLLLEYGIEFFWLDRLLIRSAENPYKVVTQEECRSGHLINAFTRFMGELDWSPNAENLYAQLSDSNIEFFKTLQQDTILYQHWGCHHTIDRYAFSPKGMPLSKLSIDSLTKFAKRYHNGEINVCRLYDLLKNNKNKEFLEEAQRIGLWAVKDQEFEKDNCYYNQYGKYGIKYFESRVEKLGVSGEAALDAGCGVGQWSFALTKKFDQVYGVDISPSARQILDNISKILCQKIPSFYAQSVTELDFQNESFDFINCYGVIFCTNVPNALKEFYRVLKPGGLAYISLNGDGWYEYLINERFKDADDEERKIYVAPIWHATLARIGGDEVLLRILDNQNFNDIPEKMSVTRARDFLYQVFPEDYFQVYKHIFVGYSDFTIVEIAKRALEKIYLLKGKTEIPRTFKQSLRDFFRNFIRTLPLKRTNKTDYRNEGMKTAYSAPYWQNRAFLPDEFRSLVSELGYSKFSWGSDACVSINQNSYRAQPIYEGYYKGQLGVWECLVYKESIV